MLKERIAIISGLRTPMGRADGQFKTIQADDLAVPIVQETILRSGISLSDIDDVIFGNVAQPSHAANIARVVSVKAGLDKFVPAVTVHRNCASGMESITTAALKLSYGYNQISLAGGTESMSNIPLLFNQKMTAFFEHLNRAKTSFSKLKVLSRFRLSFLAPRLSVIEGLTDPTCDLIMGLTAENVAKEFQLTRDEQDQYALESHKKAAKAQQEGIFLEEIHPIYHPKSGKMIDSDQSIRADQTIEALAKLRPYFDRKNGTVTVGNACPITDGAAAVVLMTETLAKERGLKPLGYLKDFAYMGLDPHRMGLGPVFASWKVLNQQRMAMSDIDLVEINEAFSAQALGCLRAFESDDFAQTELNDTSAVGAVDPSIVNVNGGAIALGHPVGMTGTRIIITLLNELHRQKKYRGLATLCVGGGQGGAVILETE